MLKHSIAALMIVFPLAVKAGCNDTYSACRNNCTGPFSGSATFDNVFGNSNAATAIIGNRIPQDCANECEYQLKACIQASRPVDPAEQGERARRAQEEFMQERRERIRARRETAKLEEASLPPKGKDALFSASLQCSTTVIGCGRNFPASSYRAIRFPMLTMWRWSV